ILRIAFALDRTRQGAVDSVRVETGKRSVTIELVTDGSDADLERYTAEQRCDLLESALDRKITIAVSSPDAADTLGWWLTRAVRRARRGRCVGVMAHPGGRGGGGSHPNVRRSAPDAVTEALRQLASDGYEA